MRHYILIAHFAMMLIACSPYGLNKQLTTLQKQNITVSYREKQKTQYILISNTLPYAISSDHIQISSNYSNAIKRITLSPKNIAQLQLRTELSMRLSYQLNQNQHLFQACTELSCASESSLVSVQNVDNLRNFFMYDGKSYKNSIQAQMRQRITVSGIANIDFLEIWVNTAVNELIDDRIIAKIADILSHAGANNDVLDVLNSVFGQIWGHRIGMPQLISANENVLRIVISPLPTSATIDIDGEESALFAYYAPHMNYRNGGSVAYSNESLSLYVNSMLLQNVYNDDALWQLLIATIAHEMQHMILFYQKGIVQNQQLPVWYAELLAYMAEYIILDSLFDVQYTDIYPIISRIEHHQNGVISMDDVQQLDFSEKSIHSFAQFLLQRYEGSRIATHLMMSTIENPEDAITDAVQQLGYRHDTFAKILHNWRRMQLMHMSKQNRMQVQNLNVQYDTVEPQESILYQIDADAHIVMPVGIQMSMVSNDLYLMEDIMNSK